MLEVTHPSLGAEVGQGARQSGSETSRETVPFTQNGRDAATPPRAPLSRQGFHLRQTAHGAATEACGQAQGEVQQLLLFLSPVHLSWGWRHLLVGGGGGGCQGEPWEWC